MPKKTHFWWKARGRRMTACGLEGMEDMAVDVKDVTCKNCLRVLDDGVVSVEVPLVAAVPIVPITPGKVPSRFDEDTHKDEVLAPTGSWVERDETSS